MVREIIEEWKQTELPQYCANCLKPCCSANIYNLTEEDVIRIFGEQEPKNPLGRPRIEKLPSGLYYTKFDAQESCPRFDGEKCQIYPERSKNCSDFPIFLAEDYPEYNEPKNLVIINGYPCMATDLENIAELCLKIIDAGFDVRHSHQMITKDLAESIGRRKFR